MNFLANLLIALFMRLIEELGEKYFKAKEQAKKVLDFGNNAKAKAKEYQEKPSADTYENMP